MNFPSTPSSDSATQISEEKSSQPIVPEFAPGKTPRATRNFMTLALFQVVMRIGWIFKTESIIMPAAMDIIGGSGWLRGCLPVLNRFGQSIPPLMASRRINMLRRKKGALFLCTVLMSASFVGMSAMWFITAGTRFWWLPAPFLLFYALFFASTGVSTLTYGTLQGKLVQANWRGRLLMLSNILGAVCAMAAAAVLMPLWLGEGRHDFALVFGFSGALFAACALVSLALSEPADAYQEASEPAPHIFSTAFQTLREDANFRRLGIVAGLFGTSMMLFPHYQALAQQKKGFTYGALIAWVIIQNGGTALFSLPAGPLADWRGNRLVLRLALFGVVCAPLAAILLANNKAVDIDHFAVVFILVGLTPVTIKVFNNYTLEICEPEEHASYLSTIVLCMSAPIILFSPLVGWLVDVVGFEPVFLTVCGLTVIGWLMTFRLDEPRHDHVQSTVVMVDADE